MVRHIGNDGLHPPKTSGGLRRATAEKGHEDAFPRPRLSVQARDLRGDVGQRAAGQKAPFTCVKTDRIVLRRIPDETIMLTDGYGLPLSTTSFAARDAYVEACEAKLTMYPGAERCRDGLSITGGGHQRCPGQRD